LEEQMRVVLPGEADAAVELDHVARDAQVGVGAEALGGVQRQRAGLVHFVERAGRPPYGGARLLDLDRAVGETVLVSLERTHRPSELLAFLRKGDGAIERLLRAAERFSSEAQDAGGACGLARRRAAGERIAGGH